LVQIPGISTAGVAIGHKILTSAYTMLSRNVDYADLGETYLTVSIRRGLSLRSAAASSGSASR
jgi:hypothetical protein